MNEPASHVEVQPAATVMLVRSGASPASPDAEGLEVLMLRRHRFATDEWGHELLGGLVEVGEPAPAG